MLQNNYMLRLNDYAAKLNAVFLLFFFLNDRIPCYD